MKKTVFLALALLCGSAAAAPGSTGGNLHAASLREWHLATPDNQRATVEDIVAKVLNVNDPLLVTRKARDVQSCISRVSENFQLRSQRVTDTAVACMAELGYLPR